MRDLARKALAVAGMLAAVVPAARAQAPAHPRAAQAPAAHNHHHNPGQAHAHGHDQGAQGHPKTWLHRRNCGQCQHAALVAKGVAVPPHPATIAPATMVVEGGCSACEGAPVVMGALPPGAVISGPIGPGTVVSGPYVAGEDAGRAVVGDLPGHHGEAPTMMAGSTPEPAPIGVVRTNFGGNPAGPPVPAGIDPMAHGRQGIEQFHGYNQAHGGPSLPSAGPFAAPGSGRPRASSTLFHALGLPVPGAGLRAYRESRRERDRGQHAAMPMGPVAGPVTDLPASAVYGPR